MEDWRRNLIEDDEDRLLGLLRSARRVAVLGIKTDAARGQPAYYVPQALQQMGLEIVPVPVYYPEAREILGQKVYRRVADVPGEIDIVDVFRRSQDVAAHLPDLLAKKPKAVWLQSGIRDDRAQLLQRGGRHRARDHDRKTGDLQRRAQRRQGLLRANGSLQPDGVGGGELRDLPLQLRGAGPERASDVAGAALAREPDRR